MHSKRSTGIFSARNQAQKSRLMELGASGRSPREPRHERARQVTFAALQGTKMQIGALAMQAIGFTNITDNLKNGI